MATMRRSGLPESLGGRVFRYDRKTTVMPIEISPRSPRWADVPEVHRGGCNCQLKFLPSGVRGRTIFSHEHLESLLRGKKEKL